MKTIRIRKFTLLSLLLIFLLPWHFLVVTHFLETNAFRSEMTDAQQKDLDETIRVIEANSENWTDSAWQARLSQHLHERNMGVSIRSATGEVLFQTDSVQERSFVATEQYSIMEDGNVIARVTIYQANSRATQLFAAIAGLLLAFLIIGLAMRRLIIKPLEQLSLSAREIAEGDLDVQLPSTRITEIAEVGEGFQVMVTGLKKSFQKLLELENERRFVLAAVVHDLRTPLFALRGYLDGLEQGIAQSPEKIAQYVAVCKEKSAQLDLLVEELFTFTKTEYYEMALNKKAVDFAQILHRAIHTLK